MQAYAMTENIKARGLDFAKFLSQVPPDLRARINAQSRKEAIEQHKQFKNAFSAGQCNFCGQRLNSFEVANPCRHWLLKPAGFRKAHFELLAKKHSWGVLENYLRWVANEQALAQNINDLADEGTGKLVELTMKYKNLAWSFSCAESDLSGHEGGGEHSKQPHYHFQMQVEGNPFIKYNDFHLSLSEEDVGFLEFMRANPGKVRKRVAGGAGMSEVLDQSMLEHLVTMGRSGTSDHEAENAPFKLDTFVLAEPGNSISGEDLDNLIQKAKAEGVTVSSKLRELKGVSVQTIVSPGPGVVRQAPRSGRKRCGDPQRRAQDRVWRERQKRGQ
jgi:hypothetical protein